MPDTTDTGLGIPPMDTTSGTSGGFNLQGLLSGLGSVGAIGTSLYDLLGSGGSSLQGLTQQAASAADPFASQRPQYMNQLQQLMTNPSSFQLSPAAQSQMQLGSQNLARQQAAQGFLGSGNILAALQNYGQQVASGDYYKQLEELNLLSGAQTGSPAAAGVSLGTLYGNRQQALQNLGGGLQSLGGTAGGLASSLGGVGSFLSQLLGGSAGEGDYTVDPGQLSNIQENLFGDTGAIDTSIDTSFDDPFAYG